MHIQKNKTYLILIILLGLSSCFSEKKANSKLSPDSLLTENDAIDEEMLQQELLEAEEELFDTESVINYSAKTSDELVDDDSKPIQEIKQREVVPKPKPKPIVQKRKNYNVATGEIISEIREALRVGNYSRVLSLSQKDDSIQSTYYRGIAYHSMMQQVNVYNTATRKKYLNEAVKTLEEVVRNTSDDTLKAKGLIWKAITIHLAYVDLGHKKQALATLERVIRSLKHTEYYNDALYYSGIIYLQMSWVGSCRYFFNKLKYANKVDGKVFDFTNNRYLTVERASQKGLRNLKSKLGI